MIEPCFLLSEGVVVVQLQLKRELGILLVFPGLNQHRLDAALRILGSLVQ